MSLPKTRMGSPSRPTGEMNVAARLKSTSPARASGKFRSSPGGPKPTAPTKSKPEPGTGAKAPMRMSGVVAPLHFHRATAVRDGADEADARDRRPGGEGAPDGGVECARTVHRVEAGAQRGDVAAADDLRRDEHARIDRRAIRHVTPGHRRGRAVNGVVPLGAPATAEGDEAGVGGGDQRQDGDEGEGDRTEQESHGQDLGADSEKQVGLRPIPAGGRFRSYQSGPRDEKSRDAIAPRLPQPIRARSLEPPQDASAA